MKSHPELIWLIKPFEALTLFELHNVLKLRVDVFVTEQKCAYSEIDGKDPECFHVMGITSSGIVVATARIAPPGVIYPYLSIGRVATSAEKRGLNYGRQLMDQALNFCRDRFGSLPIKIAAQKYLEQFYISLGFKTISESYLWDGIDHVDMILKFD